MKKLICGILALLLLTPAVFGAQSTSYTWAIDRKGNFMRTQDAYLPDRTITDLRLKEPEDIFVASDGTLYISDTGNRRVLVYDITAGKVTREITCAEFQKPRGIYVTKDMHLYVADSAAGAVFRFDDQDNLIQSFTRPESPAFGDTAYAPTRVAVDVRGSLYIVGEGVSGGIIQLSVTGEFLGFFATNKVTLTVFQLLQNIFFTEAQMATLTDRMPGTFSNVYTDSRGIVYSSTMGREGEGVKKHNMKGANMFKDVISFRSLSDITTDNNGIIYACDSRGFISVYSANGDFIFDFGAWSTEDIAGVYAYLSAVAVENDGTIWTLDYEKAYLQSYKPTEYTLSIYDALALFNQGRYTDAEERWQTVLRYNQTSVLAHDGIGKANLYTQKYDEAKLHFELSGNRTFYSQAFWEIRNLWLRSNLIWILGGCVAVGLFAFVLRFADAKRRVRRSLRQGLRRTAAAPAIRDIAFAFSVMRHPLDSYYDLKRHNRGGYGGAVLLTALLFLSMMLYQTSKSYLLQTTAVEDLNLTALVGGFFGIIFLFVTCNYLVTSINDGEGSIGDIFKMTAYASMPLTLAFTLITTLSYVLTFNEVFLVDLILWVGAGWFVLTLYLGLQEIHNYNVKNTVKSILFTAGFMVIALIALLIFTILFQQMSQFVEAVGREAIGNVTGQY